MRPDPLCALVLAASAYAHVGGEPSVRLETLRVGDAVFPLQYQPEDARAAEQIRRALPRAAGMAQRWGRFTAPVLIVVHPTHQALEAAAHREGYPWLRAWARYASVDLQSPRSWSRGDASDGEMVQLLAHELTHCVMFQSAAAERTWSHLGIPLWFQEGMASVTAGQAHREAEAIWRFYRGKTDGHGAAPAGDPLTDPEPLCRSDSSLVYGTAHQAFHFLLDRYGEDRARRVLVGMGEGGSFDDAFRAATGIAVRDFESDFRRYVVTRGWRSRRDRGSAPPGVAPNPGEARQLPVAAPGQPAGRLAVALQP